MSASPDVTRLIAEHRPQLKAFCAQFHDDPHDRDELAQLVMIRVWRGHSRFHGRSSFSTWLYQIVRRTAATEYARRVRRPMPIDVVRDDVHPLGHVAAAPLEDVVAVRNGLGSALTALDARLRMAVELVDLWGLSHIEAAQVCGVPETTMRTRLFRGRRALRASLTTQAA